jgi:hypothetical protein
MYHFRCGACGAVLKVPDRALGRLVACSSAGCDGKTRLPKAAEVDTLPWLEVEARAELSRPSRPGVAGLFRRGKLRRQVEELERTLESRFREIGNGALDPLAGGESLGEARAEVVAAGRRLTEAQARADASAGPATRQASSREVDRLILERGEAIARLGRRAVRSGELVEPAALADVNRLEGELAEHRSRLDALGGGFAEAVGRLRSALIRLIRAAAILLALFGLGWGAFAALEHYLKLGAAEAVGGSADPLDAAVCLVTHANRAADRRREGTAAKAPAERWVP